MQKDALWLVSVMILGASLLAAKAVAVVAAKVDNFPKFRLSQPRLFRLLL